MRASEHSHDQPERASYEDCWRQTRCDYGPSKENDQEYEHGVFALCEDWMQHVGSGHPADRKEDDSG